MQPAAPLRHVVVVSIGPVQPFIAAARRTRDLWYGSVLLSRLAEAAARAIVGACAAPATAELVFPPAVRTASKAGGQSGRMTAGISNKVVCVVAGIEPAAPVSAVRTAVQTELDKVGNEALSAVRSEGCRVEEQRFRAQLRQLLECFGAWAPWLGEGAAGYIEAYRSANELLDARKRLRDFQPNATALPGLPLSSLDAAAETVIPSDRDGRRLRSVFGVDATEELDAIGVVKRVLGRAQGFPAVTRIALAPWVAAWPSAAIQAVEAALAPLEPFKVASRNKCNPPDPASTFRWDGELLLPSRRRALQDRSRSHAEAIDKSPDALAAALAGLEGVVCQHRDELALPEEDRLYVALLLADGDSMGALLSDGGNTLASHGAISAALATFAGAVQQVVFAAGGACIYAGGDDVLALCPVASALPCARELADAFTKGWPPLPQIPGFVAPTLSVGVAIAHVLTPFGTLRRLAERAKELAKNGHAGEGLRNAIGIVVQPRNGATVEVSGRWNEASGVLPCDAGFDHRMRWWTAAFAGGALARSASYDLATLARAVPEEALAGEAMRLVGRRIDEKILGGDEARRLRRHVADRLHDGDAVDAAAATTRLADEWYVARWLSAHPQPLGASRQPATTPNSPVQPVVEPVQP